MPALAVQGLGFEARACGGRGQLAAAVAPHRPQAVLLSSTGEDENLVFSPNMLPNSVYIINRPAGTSFA